jgi:hypothetical protein
MQAALNMYFVEILLTTKYDVYCHVQIPGKDSKSQTFKTWHQPSLLFHLPLRRLFIMRYKVQGACVISSAKTNRGGRQMASCESLLDALPRP